MALTEVIYPLGAEPLEATCCCCGRRNGDLVQSVANGQLIGEPKPFSQPMVLIGADRWAHVGCWADEAWDRSKDDVFAEHDYAEADADREYEEHDRDVARF